MTDVSIEADFVKYFRIHMEGSLRLVAVKHHREKTPFVFKVLATAKQISVRANGLCHSRASYGSCSASFCQY